MPTTDAARPADDAAWRDALDPAAFPVEPDEDPWTLEELREIVDELEADIERTREIIEQTQAELVGIRDGSDVTGRDPADVGSANFERDHEMSLVRNSEEVLDQSRRALAAIKRGTYGSCENCGQPIGKGRLQIIPRATLCLACKQREERR
ncbi:TraR/DksA family transcriptional regulator [Raineyella fluvialis]|uniref:TraR/DksA family transcriptional regulator n=1 Tax=Raineyella fluvialis TaxID=2662261 RepID=A0A5Q2FBI7_9ACTN|nr:TraR/DksA C4-type zinc finger protein [Raineyella fluvialis]QGF24242.1 TraR/DksA family transcriptional regulator [Raineyella fluvialis]